MIGKYRYLHEWLGRDLAPDHISISALVDHSSEVAPGDVFVDMHPDHAQSVRFMAQAIQRGASAILTVHPHVELQTTVPIIFLPSLKQQIASLACDFYNQPSQWLSLLGVTGTNGKTTTALLMSHAAHEMGQKSAYIGTVGFGSPSGYLQSTGLTTPSAVRLQRILHDMVEENVNLVALEVSSHALVQQRVAGSLFDVGIFTNLTRDHLDYHQSMFDYAQAKKKFFTEHQVNHKVINIDDPVGLQWAQEADCSVLPFSFKRVESRHPAAYFELEYCDMRGTALRLESPWGKGQLKSPLMGRFNSYNLAAAWLGLVALGFDIQETAHALAMVQNIPGRFEVYRPSHLKPTVVVDYAHTPSALEEMLKALRALTSHHVWVVFGCGGDRDPGKRPLMGQIAERLADRVMLTNDNPRQEDPEAIISDILKGMICPWAVEIELDRAQAIYRVIHEAKAGDVVLVAGKGHEEMQIAKGQRLSFSDKTHVLNALGMHKEREL